MDVFFKHDLEGILEISAEVIQIIGEHTADDHAALLSDCPFPDRIEEPLLLLRVLFGAEHIRELEYRDDPELVAQALNKWVQILRRAAQGAQSGQRQAVARAQDGVHPHARGAAPGGQ